MSARSSLSQMPPLAVFVVPTNLRPIRALPRSGIRLPLSEDEDEEDVEDEEDEEDTEDEDGMREKKQDEEDSPPPPVSRDILRLSDEASGAPGSSESNDSHPLELAAGNVPFNPDWTLQDLEYTSLAFGKKSSSSVSKSIS